MLWLVGTVCYIETPHHHSLICQATSQHQPQHKLAHHYIYH